MSRYIDADELKARKQLDGETYRYYIKIEDVYSAPHIDIVRCKECAKWLGSSGICMWDKSTSLFTKPDDFCSYGERKSDE